MSYESKFRTFAEAKAAFEQDVAEFEARGVIIPGAKAYATDAMKQKVSLAYDALPTLNTAANAGVPALFTTFVDPSIYEVVFAPQKAVEIAGERKIGDWTKKEALFPTVEHTFEVSSYGDYNTNGRAGVNANWPARQSYLFQIVKEYGDLEVDAVGEAQINYIAQVDRAAAAGLNRYQNFSYFFGINGLQNYGLLNDPNLSASATPTTKTAGNGNVWIYQNAPNATANEVFADVQTLVSKLIGQTNGLIDENSKMKLCMSPLSSNAMATTNSFGLTARKMIADAYPNMEIVTAPQYGVVSSTNPQGIAAGNLVQLFAEEIEGQETVFCAFNEKLRAHQPVRALSSIQQKVTGGTFGAVWRMPVGCVSMIGV